MKEKLSSAAGGAGSFLLVLKKSVFLSHENVQRVHLTLINSKILFLSMILSIKIEFIGRPILLNLEIIRKNRKQAKTAIFE